MAAISLNALWVKFITSSFLFCLMTFAHSAEPDWNLYNEILKEYTSIQTHHNTKLTWVNYSKLKHEANFQEVVKQLEAYPIDQLETHEEKLSFYINAYNIFAIRLIIDNWPVKSIKDIGPFYLPVWRNQVGYLGGEPVTLHHIEHVILRSMNEPRIHMAIVCASISCPDLRQEPYTAKQLNGQLDDQVKQFLANSSKGMKIENDLLRVSKIFKWFAKDFKDYGNPEQFIRHYLNIPEGLVYKANLDYLWPVNGS